MAKKPTIKQLEERLNLVTSQLNFVMRMLDSIGIAFSNFVRFKGEEEEFKKYLENNKNLHKLSKEENEDRKKGHNKESDNVSTKEVRKESNGKQQNKLEKI